MTELVRARHRADSKAITPLTPLTNSINLGFQQVVGDGVDRIGRGGAMVALSSGLVAATALTAGAVLDGGNSSDASANLDVAAANLSGSSLNTVNLGATVSRGGKVASPEAEEAAESASASASVSADTAERAAKAERAERTRSETLAAERASRSAAHRELVAKAPATATNSPAKRTAAATETSSRPAETSSTREASSRTAEAEPSRTASRTAEPTATETAEPAPKKTEAKAEPKAETKTEAAAPAARGSSVLAIAARYVGIQYRYGGTTPAGFDCSGYTQYVFNQVGISLPRTAQAQMNAGTRISRSQARPGDLVFVLSSSGATTGHVGIYAGDNMMYDSPRTGKAISKRSIWTSNVAFARVS